MDKTTLVDSDLKTGRWVIEELERRGIIVDVAAWIQDEDSGEWRLLVSSLAGDQMGSRPVLEVIQTILDDLKISDLDLSDFRVAGPHQNMVKDLKRHVSTDHGFHEDEIWLGPIGLGGREYRSSRVYRALGDAIGNAARVRVRATGQLGTVRGVFDTAAGPRYLVLYDVNRDDIRPLRAGEPVREAGRDYAADDLDFLYVVKTGGWPDEYPDWLIEATMPNGADRSGFVGKIRRTH